MTWRDTSEPPLPPTARCSVFGLECEHSISICPSGHACATLLLSTTPTKSCSIHVPHENHLLSGLRAFPLLRSLSVSLLLPFRYEDESIVGEKLYPAFEEYLSLYISDLLKASAEGGDPSPEAQAKTLDRHRAYDQYNAERDPAHGLFRNYYGEDFSEDFMDNFLFELSTRPPEGYPKGGARAGGGGGEGGRPKGGNPHA